MDQNNKLFLPITVVAAGLLVAGAVVWNGSRPSSNPQVAQSDISIDDIDIAGRPFIGDENAPVVIATWVDFQCPSCRLFEVGRIATPEGRGTSSAMSEILETYVTTGKVKMVFKDLAFLGSDSLTAARYGRAMWKLYPEKYLEWREAMFNAQDKENSGFGDEDSIKLLASKIEGVNVDTLANDVSANKSEYDAAINADKQEAGKAGIQSTPSFVVGNQLVTGAYPFATYQAAIESVLTPQPEG